MGSTSANYNKQPKFKSSSIVFNDVTLIGGTPHTFDINDDVSINVVDGFGARIGRNEEALDKNSLVNGVSVQDILNSEALNMGAFHIEPIDATTFSIESNSNMDIRVVFNGQLKKQ